MLNLTRITNMYYENKWLTRLITNQFHRLFYYRQPWKKTYWFGQQLLKCPFDLWVYQELIYKVKPDIIIECGTYKGGSAYYFASILDLINKGRVITIDVCNEDQISLSSEDTVQKRPVHERIQYLLGSTISDTIIDEIQKQISSDDVVMVILDSNHLMDHVFKEMELYSKFVSKGSYLIVEDSNLFGHPIRPERYRFGKGPFEATELFLSQHSNFIIDEECEKYFMTFNPSGYLLRTN